MEKQMIIGYLRVSTLEQSLGQQQRAIIDYCESHNMVIDKFISDEGISAYSKSFEERNGMLEVLKLAEANKISDLIIFESSRISRRYGESVSLFDRLTMRGIKIHSVVDNGVINAQDIDQLMNAFRSYMNQQSSKLTSERIKAKLSMMKDNGIYCGGSVLWGFKVVDRKVVTDDDMKDTVVEFFNDYISHGAKYCIDKYNLNSRVVLNKRIKNEAYIEIVGADLFNYANKVRIDRVCRKDYVSKTNKSNRLFEGLLYHNCGKKLYLSKQNNGSYYRCYDKCSGTRKTYKADILEDIIESEIVEVFNDLSYEKLKEQYLLRIEKLKLIYEVELDTVKAESEHIKNQLKQLKKKLAHFLCEDDVNSNVIHNISNLISDNETELTILEERKKEVSAKWNHVSNKIEKQLRHIDNILNAKEIYMNSSIEAKKSILCIIINKIIVSDYENIKILLNI